MTSGSDLADGSTGALLGVSPQAVSTRSGDNPRVDGFPDVRGGALAGDRARARAIPIPEVFSPFVLAMDDSESADADTSRTSLAVSDRLAGDQQDRSLQARGWAVRALQAASWPPCRATRGHRWDLVGCRDRGVARWPRPSAPPRAGLCSARCHSDDPETRLSGDRAPQPRPDVQRATLAQPRGALPSLSHDPRRSRTSAAPVVECLPPPRIGRPLHRTLHLAALGARYGARRLQFVLSGMKETPCLLSPAPRQRKGCRWTGRALSGAQHGRSPSDLQAHGDDTTAAGR
jgi:hypothetical protein